MMSWTFDLFENNVPVTTLNTRWLREAGMFQWQEARFRLGREGFCSGDFFLARGDQVKVRAQKTSPLTRTFRLDIHDQEMVLSANSPFGRTFQLTRQGIVQGSIRPNHPFTRKCRIDLPDDLDTPTQVFIFWLVVLMWRRTSRSSE